MRIVTEFNAPGVMAPAHFLPRFDPARCTFCGRCARHCPTAALAIDTRERTLHHRLARCIGCGLCVVACDRRGAVIDRPLPHKRWRTYQLHTTAEMLKSAWSVWRQRR